MSTAHGTIRRRLLVNATVDPDEVARRLPDGLRPHITPVGTVVGCCMLDIAAIRPAGMPATVGRQFRAAAHRMSVDWEDSSGDTVTGVYVLVRHTDSQLAVLLGGRWFPGLHERAGLDLSTAGPHLAWSSVPADADPGLAIHVVASVPDDRDTPRHDEVAAACLDSTIALSPGRRRPLEVARMETSHRRAVPVVVEDLRSEFIDGFASARPTTSYLMSDVDVVWSTAAEQLPTVAISA